VLLLHGLLDYLPGPGFVLVVGGAVGGGALDRGKPLADGGGHDVDDAAALLLQGGVEVYSPFP
jgi:hypothetical protein